VELVKTALEEHGFMEGSRKVIASQIKETHNLVITDLLIKYDFFEAHDEKTIIGALSCFTNVNVSSDARVSVPSSESEDVHEMISYVMNKMDEYEAYETKHGFYSGSDYSINFNVCDEIMAWCDVENADQAVVFLKKIRQDKGIFVGEFVKGVLKIANILKEHEKIFTELVPKLEYVEKIKRCYELLLKFVCTSQSLYV
jgi:hypothetical protein